MGREALPEGRVGHEVLLESRRLFLRSRSGREALLVGRHWSKSPASWLRRVGGLPEGQEG